MNWETCVKLFCMLCLGAMALFSVYRASKKKKED